MFFAQRSSGATASGERELRDVAFGEMRPTPLYRLTAFMV